MRPRFYVPDLDATAARVPLPDDEAEHLARVLRLGVGAEVEVFDGRGGLWRAEVVEAGKRSAAVRALAPVTPAPEITIPVVLVISVLKADKMDDVVRDAVMLGASGIRPVVSDRSEISLATLEKSQRVARWQRIAVSSAKQCGRAVVPVVTAAQSLAAYLAEPISGVRLMCVEPAAGAASTSGNAAEPPSTPRNSVGHPSAPRSSVGPPSAPRSSVGPPSAPRNSVGPPSAPRNSVGPPFMGGRVSTVQEISKPTAAHVIVGPEGGWAAHELATALAAGAVPVALGGRILRADAAPLVALTALLTTWSEL